MRNERHSRTLITGVNVKSQLNVRYITCEVTANCILPSTSCNLFMFIYIYIFFFFFFLGIGIRGNAQVLAIRIYTHAFHGSVHRDAYIAIPLRRHHSGRMYNGGAGGGGGRSGYSVQGRFRGHRRKAFVGHLVDPRFPGREPVQRRRRRLVARLVPRQFFAARRVNLRVIVSDVRLDAHGFRCKH